MAERRKSFKPLRAALGLAALASFLATGARAADEAPDLDFLEYLGSWSGDDEEWIAVSEWERKEEETAKAPPEEERKDDEKET